MALKEAYITNECSQLLGMAVKNLLRRAEREGWQSRKRHGRGGGKPFFVQGSVQTGRAEIEAFFAGR